MNLISLLFFAAGIAVLLCAAGLLQGFLQARSRRSLHTLIAVVTAAIGVLVLFTGRADGPGLEIGPHARPLFPSASERAPLPVRAAASAIYLAIAAGSWFSRPDRKRLSGDHQA